MSVQYHNRSIENQILFLFVIMNSTFTLTQFVIIMKEIGPVCSWNKRKHGQTNI